VGNECPRRRSSAPRRPASAATGSSIGRTSNLEARSSVSPRRAPPLKCAPISTSVSEGAATLTCSPRASISFIFDAAAESPFKRSMRKVESRHLRGHPSRLTSFAIRSRSASRPRVRATSISLMSFAERCFPHRPANSEMGLGSRAIRFTVSLKLSPFRFLFLSSSYASRSRAMVLDSMCFCTQVLYTVYMKPLQLSAKRNSEATDESGRVDRAGFELEIPSRLSTGRRSIPCAQL